MFSKDALLSFSTAKKEAKRIKSFRSLKRSLCDGPAGVTLGVANDEQFVPVDNELFISQTKQQAVDYQFNDGQPLACGHC